MQRLVRAEGTAFLHDFQIGERLLKGPASDFLVPVCATLQRSPRLSI